MAKGLIGALINDKTAYLELNQTMDGIRDVVAHAQAGVTDFQENMEAMKHNFFVRGYFKNRGYEDSAELAKDEIVSLPQGTPQKTFTFEAKQLFGKVDTAKLKNQKSLDAAGDFLTDTDFGVAVVAALSSMEGDAGKDLVLTQGRALVVREYLVENFGFDDRRLKTLAMGKKSGTSPESGWGTIQILVYPAALKCRPRSCRRIALHPRPPQNCRFPNLPLPFQNHSSPEAPAKVLRPRMKSL